MAGSDYELNFQKAKEFDTRYYEDFEAKFGKKRDYYILSSSITPEDIQKIAILKSKKINKTILTSFSNLQKLNNFFEKNENFKSFVMYKIYPFVIV